MAQMEVRSMLIHVVVVNITIRTLHNIVHCNALLRSYQFYDFFFIHIQYFIYEFTLGFEVVQCIYSENRSRCGILGMMYYSWFKL